MTNVKKKPSVTDIRKLAAAVQLIVFDFDGVFTDNRVLVLQDGTEGVMCNRSDGLGIEMLRAHGIDMMVLSKEKNPVVSARCSKLHLKCIQGCDDKEGFLRKMALESEIPLDRIAYMGNDVNDLECMKLVGFPVCVSDAYPEVKKASLLITKNAGGCGAVREFCDFIARTKEHTSRVRPR